MDDVISDVTAAEAEDKGVNGHHYSAVDDRVLDACC